MIYTFYSYKGGVGRSMALVNIAELMYRAGSKVIMVDWDLEAPGLERYYPERSDDVLHRPGIIDLLINYKERAARYRPQSDTPILSEEELKSCLVDIYPDTSSTGKLWLLPAGRRADRQFIDYATQVKTFDWQDFYQNWEGEVYFEWLRTQLNSLADTVVIDARTGVTEMGGVCTYQLADMIVMLCAANQQNMDGTQRMLESFSNPQLPELRHGRALQFIVAPARIERLSETQTLNRFRQEFARRFLQYMPEALQKVPASLVNLEIPYVPRYAFEELIAVGQRHSDERSVEMETAYGNLYRAITQGNVVLPELRPSQLHYINFDILVSQADSNRYQIIVLNSPAGEARELAEFSTDLLITPPELPRPSYQHGFRFSLQPDDQRTSSLNLQQYGTRLFDFLFRGRIRLVYEKSRISAESQSSGLRIRLRTDDSDVASVFWEYLYDAERSEYLSLSRNTPLVRYLELAQSIKPILVSPPLRMLCVAVDPIDIGPRFDIGAERRAIEQATEHLIRANLLQITWLEGTTLRSLQKAMRSGSWHIFHFTGHGAFDEQLGESVIVMEDEQNRAQLVSASRLAQLLVDHRSLRLAILITTESGRTGNRGVISSVAATLVRSGIPAAIGLQHDITNVALTELTRSFYDALAEGFAIDTALSEGRKAINFLTNRTEWGAPVLYTRVSDGMLFDLITKVK